VKVDCYPISLLPRQSRLFLDYTSSHDPLAPFFASTPWSTSWANDIPQQDPTHRNALADLLLEQNNRWFDGSGASPDKTRANIERLRHGAGAVLAGQQVALFGGPLFTLLKAATIIRRAQDANAGVPGELARGGGGSVPVFWLASEDHDLAEADHVILPARHALHTLRLNLAGVPSVPGVGTMGRNLDPPPASKPGVPGELARGGGKPGVPGELARGGGKPVGNLPLGPNIAAVLDRAAELIGGTPEFDLLTTAYTPTATFTSAFARLLAATFADYGLVVIDASTRAFHALGAPVLRHAITDASALESALHQRDQLLAERGYHSQVLVAPGSSLLFLIDEATGARQPLRRKNGSWLTGKNQHTTADLLAILDTAPERLSPNALLRPVFQDFLLPTQAIIGGPAEIAYYAQNQVLYQAILGRTTPVLPRLTATLIEPALAKILDQYQLTLEDILTTHPDELAHRLGARSLPIEGKRRLSAAGNALDDELDALLAWTESLDPALARAAQVSASKMRYQMNRLRRLAANDQLQRDSSIRRHVDTLSFNLFPDRHPQERTIGGIAYLARYGSELLATLVDQATQDCPGHKAIWL
jgi:bacillithiol biosynthesis cysteine-adding enzyme BshC